MSAGEGSVDPSFELGIDSFVQSFEITDQLLGDLDRVDIIQSRALRDTTEVFTEFRALAELAVRHRGDRTHLRGRSYFSLGSDVLREGGMLDLRLGRPSSAETLDLRGEVEARQFRAGSDYALASDLIESKFQGRWRRALSDRYSVALRGRAEWTEYAQRSEFELDRRRLELSAVGALESGFDLSWDLEAGGGHTAVPDSSGIAFDRGFLFSDLYTRLGRRMRAGLYTAVDRRVYADEDLRSPTWNFLAEPHLSWRTEGGGRIRASLSLEWLTHEQPSDTYFDLVYGRSGLLFEGVRGSWTYSAEPRWSWLSSPSDVEDRYVQPSVALRLEYFGMGKLWFSLSEELGQRYYRESGDPDLRLYSDYAFLRTTLLASYQLHERVRIDGFLSDEPESHQLVEDDSRLSLFNLSVRCSL